MADFFAGCQFPIDINVDGAGRCIKGRYHLMPVLKPVGWNLSFQADPLSARTAGCCGIVDKEFYDALILGRVADIFHCILAVALRHDGAVRATRNFLWIDERFQRQTAGQIKCFAGGQCSGTFQGCAVANAAASF